MKIRQATAAVLIALSAGIVFSAAHSQQAFAKVCGGLNQRACPKVLPGPQCKAGLIKVGKWCRKNRPGTRPIKPRPCGKLGQPACPKILPGPQCQPGLKNIRGRCLRFIHRPLPGPHRCGGLRQRACPKVLPGPQCKRGLRVVRGICVPGLRPPRPTRCGGLRQRACPKVLPGRSCGSRPGRRQSALRGACPECIVRRTASRKSFISAFGERTSCGSARA